MNPFNNIVPQADELLVNEDLIKEMSERIREHIALKRLIVVEGEYGSGKTHFLTRLYSRLKTKKELLDFTDVITKVLEAKVPVKNKSIFIKNFDLSVGLNDEQLTALGDVLLKSINAGVIIVISARKATVRRLFKINPLLMSKHQRIKVQPLPFDDAKKLVLMRLNSVRKEPISDLSPFTEKELRMIWKKSSGNPRLLLLLLMPLYDQRMMLSD